MGHEGVRHPDAPLAIVSGASRGIGRAVACRLAPSHDLLLGGRDIGALNGLAELLGTARARPWPVDITDHAALARATAGITRLDVLVHCAGVLTTAPVSETTGDMWRQVLETNLIAAGELTRLLLPALRAAAGCVVFVNSTVARRCSTPGVAAYAASKFGLGVLADCLRREEADHGVRVSSVYPGRVDTDMQRGLGRDVEGRPADALQPPAVAEAVWFAVTAGRDTAIEELTIRPAGF